MRLFTELKRRNVFRACAAYAVVAWALLQAADFVLDAIDAPNWVIQVFILGALVLLPVVGVFSWAFEWTPEGVKRESEVDRAAYDSPQRARKLDRVIIAFLVLAVALLLFDRFRLAALPDGADSTGAGAASRSIAVLPFRDMSAGQDQAYFGEGIAEELLNALVRLQGLKVASRTSSFALATENLDVAGIADRLGVDHILEGSVRTSGNRVRVTAQLISVADDTHLWSETYDGTLDDIFEIQDEITGKIVRALRVELGGAGPELATTAVTHSPEAYRLFLQGRHLWRQRNTPALHHAVELFEQAVELDPSFHQAWANLGIAYVNLPNYDLTLDETEYFERALHAAETALALEPTSPEALVLKANYMEYRCRLVTAAEQYEAALKSSPGDPTAHHWYATMLAFAGHTRTALEQIQVARDLDPAISAVISTEALIQGGLGNYERADQLHREAVALGIYGGSTFEVGLNHVLAGDLERARPHLATGRDADDPRQREMARLFLAALDDPARWPELTAFLGTAEEGGRYPAGLVVLLLTTAGSPYVFEYLEPLSCPYVDVASAFWTEPFRAQRGTPQFFRLMERAGAVEFWRQRGWPDDCASLDQDLADCP